MNTPQKVRLEDQLNLSHLKKYLIDHLEPIKCSSDLKLKQFAGGASNLTYELSWGNSSIILRTSPKGANIKSAHDMAREFKVLRLLEPHFKFAPKAVHLCENEEVIGRDFYLMEKIEGHIPRKNFPFEVTPNSTRTICKNLMDVQISLHDLDINRVGLQDLGRPKGYIGRQVQGWCQRYSKAMTKEALKAQKLMNWLLDNQPQDQDSSIIHNDFKLDNVVFDTHDNEQIIAVLDWEMATLGSPLMDLGCSLAYWIEATDPQPMQMLRMMPTHLEGMMTRKELINYYAQKRNLNIDDFEYFYIFGLFRLAGIVQQIYQRYVRGNTTNPAFKSFGDIAKILIQSAESQI